MKVATELQPDQQAARWDDHVAVYETVFEPLTNAFASHALDQLGLRPGHRLVDVGAGSGGAALMAAARGADVLAIDASQRMVSRIRARAEQRVAGSGRLRAGVMDGMALALSDATFDAAISVFGVILFPDAGRGMREIARVLAPGGRAAIVTWTEPEKYELAARLLGAVAAVRGPLPPPAVPPAQLRFTDRAALRNLLGDAGLIVDDVIRLEQTWRLPSARWLADHIAFAPGMAALLAAQGADRAAILDCFVAALERDQGQGEVALSAVAHAAIGTRSPVTNC
jgi:SAM-dependent methyltransferase